MSYDVDKEESAMVSYGRVRTTMRELNEEFRADPERASFSDLGAKIGILVGAGMAEMGELYELCERLIADKQYSPQELTIFSTRLKELGSALLKAGGLVEFLTTRVQEMLHGLQEANAMVQDTLTDLGIEKK